MKQSNLGPHPEWDEFLTTLGAGPERLRAAFVDPNDDQTRLESYKHLLIGLCNGINMSLFPDPNFPVWVQNAHFPFGYVGPNPDSLYYYTQVNPDGIYRLWGRRNSVHTASIQVGTEWWGASYMPEHSVSENINKARNCMPLASYDFDHDIQFGADGSFELILSRERPEGWQGNWWHMPPGSHNLYMRYFAYDVENEVDPEVHVERLDGPARPARIPGHCYGNAIGSAAHHAVELLGFFADLLAAQRRDFGENQFKMTTYGGAGHANQAYLQACYAMAEDEALIIESDVPKQCDYWNFQICNELFTVFDYINTQTSLNGFSAQLDADGKLRAVVSMHDPGVPNWLDNGGHGYGVLLGRWTHADSHPLPTIRRVKLRELRNFLPPQTPAVSTGERQAVLKRHRNAHLRRLRI